MINLVSRNFISWKLPDFFFFAYLHLSTLLFQAYFFWFQCVNLSFERGVLNFLFLLLSHCSAFVHLAKDYSFLCFLLHSTSDMW